MVQNGGVRGVKRQFHYQNHALTMGYGLRANTYDGLPLAVIKKDFIPKLVLAGDAGSIVSGL